MSITAGALRELHRIHRQTTDLREQLERGPELVIAGKTAVERSDKVLAEEKETLTRMRVGSDEKQLQLKGREDRIVELNGKLNACASNREFQALKEQIAADEQANNVLSDEILESLEKIDAQENLVAQVQANVEKARQELAASTRRVEETQQDLQSELERVTRELGQAESALPADFRVEYQRVTRARGEDALAQVEGDCCGGCYQTLTPQCMNLLYMSKPLFCKSCGCLLYLPEDRSVGS